MGTKSYFVLLIFSTLISTNKISLKSALGGDPSELVDVLQAAMTISGGTSPLDVVCRTQLTDRFGDELVKAETVDFRLQIDIDNERVSWAGRSKKDDFTARDSNGESGTVEYWSFTILKGRIIRYKVNEGSSSNLEFESFEEALSKTLIPLPQFWCILPFGSSTDGVKQLDLITSQIIFHPLSKISVLETPSGIRYLVRKQTSEEKFDVYSWDFELPEYLPKNLTIDRAADGNPVRYWEQSVIWDRTNGTSVPSAITSDTLIVRPVGNLYETGNREAVSELGWISDEVSIQSGRASVMLSGIREIELFLDSGRACLTEK